MKRSLPTDAEAAAILARRKTRPQRRPPMAAGRRLNRLVKSLDERFGKGAGALHAHWREIAGESLARATEPVRFIPSRTGPGALEIRVDGPAAALIQHQAPQIIARANLFLGQGTVGRLRIVQGPVKAAASQARAPRRKPPLDAAKEAALAASLADAPETLKEALTRLGRGVLRSEAALTKTPPSASTTR